MTIKTLEQHILYFFLIDAIIQFPLKAIATNRLNFADLSKTCRTLFYMISVCKGFVRFNTNTTAFKKHEKLIIIVELKKIGHRNIDTGTTLQLETLIK